MTGVVTLLHYVKVARAGSEQSALLLSSLTQPIPVGLCEFPGYFQLPKKCVENDKKKRNKQHRILAWRNNSDSSNRLHHC